VLNRQGYWISLWRPFADLTNFRTKFTPQNHPKYIWARPATASKAKVAALLQALGTDGVASISSEPSDAN